MVRERPIIFDAESVRAILAGHKFMTRRVVKPQPPEGFGVGFCPYAGGWAYEKPSGGCTCDAVRCPYGCGAPGDQLYVREAFGYGNADRVDCQCLIYRADGRARQLWGYTDDDEPRHAGRYVKPAGDPSKWKTPLYMPRWASRITLDVLSIRAERLQDITEADAIAEGAYPCPWLGVRSGFYTFNGVGEYRSAADAYRARWDAINAKRGFPFESNPWVFAVTFQRSKP